jgi:molecular chaperone GrpE (heat shock protein)
MSSDPESFYPALPPHEQPPVATQLVQRFLQLAGQFDTLQAEVNRLTAALAEERSQIDALIEHLGKNVSERDPLQERLVELTEQMSADHDQFNYLNRKLTELATQEQLVRLATVVATQEQVMELAAQVQEIARTQQRSHELTEARNRQITDILTLAQTFLNRRSRLENDEVVLNGEQLEAARSEARGEFAAHFLPALDGLESILEEGRALLARHRQEMTEMNQPPHVSPSADRPQSSGSLVHRLRSRLSGEGEAGEAAHSSHSAPYPAQTTETTTVSMSALHAWLRNLALVRDRFLTLMAQEGIQPIQALKQPFDPRLHVVVQSEQRDDVPPNTVVREVRRGFRQANRVLRYAEVVVARAPYGSSTTTPSTTPSQPGTM